MMSTNQSSEPIISDADRIRLDEIFADQDITVVQSQSSLIMHNFEPNKYGRWVKQGDTFSFRLNKKGKHRMARRGEL